MTINELKQAIANEKPRSAWGRGVKGYAEGLAEELEGGHTGRIFCRGQTDRPRRTGKQKCSTARRTGANTAGAAARGYI